eukprot:SAG31_NODE_11675_length_1007_cov_2.201542_2_plen_132_part_00
MASATDKCADAADSGCVADADASLWARFKQHRAELEDFLKREGAAAFNPRSEAGFTGLLNQGATCYMNSLLQALYMTPEFRSSVYKFRHDQSKHGPAKSCIPLQLQHLFARMQLGNRAALSTKALTASFGW